MGWGTAGTIFERVADSLLESGAPDDVVTEVCSDLISLLRSEDWDTHHDSLAQYSTEPAIIAAFRQHDIHLPCETEDWEGDHVCTLNDGHDGDHDDGNGHRWRDIAPDTLIDDARDLTKVIFNRLRDFIGDDDVFGDGLSWDVLPDWLTGDGTGRALWAHGSDNAENRADNQHGGQT